MRRGLAIGIVAASLAACGAPAETRAVTATAPPRSSAPTSPAPATTAAPPAAAEPATGVACSVTAEDTFAGPREATATAATHTAACAAAAAQVRASGAGSITRIDGVVVGWLIAPSDDRLPDGALAEDVGCELVVAHDVGPRASGSGSGASEAEAYALARADACRALGETDCSDAAGFRARVTERRASHSFGSAGARSAHDVTLTVARVRLAEGRGVSRASRAAACRDAYRAACGADRCPETSALESLDGVVLSPPPS